MSPAVKTTQPALHGEQHLPYGSDPIPGLFGSGYTVTSYRDLVMAEPSLLGFWPHDDPSGLSFNNIVDPAKPLTAHEYASTPFAYEQAGPFTDDSELSILYGGTDTGTILNTGNWAEVAYGSIMNSDLPWTVELWAYPTATGYGYLWLEGDRAATINAYIQVSHASPSDMILQASRGAAADWGSYVMTVNTWHHIAMTYDGADVRVYAQGDEVFTFPSSGVTHDNRFYFGGLAQTSTGPQSVYFDGRISMAAFYTAALDATTIASHAGVTAGGGTGVAAAGAAYLADGSGGTYWDFPLEVTY